MSGGFLFESRLKQSYNVCGLDNAGLTRAVHPHLLKHQMLTFRTAQGLSDAKNSTYLTMGIERSLELYQHPSLAAIEGDYQKVVCNLEI